jgi:hypothetical protein
LNCPETDAENVPTDVQDAFPQLLSFRLPEIETPGILIPEVRVKLNTAAPLTAPIFPLRYELKIPPSESELVTRTYSVPGSTKTVTVVVPRLNPEIVIPDVIDIVVLTPPDTLVNVPVKAKPDPAIIKLVFAVTDMFEPCAAAVTSRVKLMAASFTPPEPVKLKFP